MHGDARGIRFDDEGADAAPVAVGLNVIFGLAAAWAIARFRFPGRAFLTALIQFVAIAAAVFFFVVKPVQAMLARTRPPVEEGLPDEERRHREVITALERLQR